MKKFKRIYVEITNACNLSCTICPGTLRKTTFMSPQAFESVLRRIKPFTDYLYLHVLGEPLLHPEFPQILKACEISGFRVNIATNGVLIKKHKDVLLNSKVIRQINFSIHCLEIQKNSILPENYLDDILGFIEEGRKISDMYFALRLWNLKSRDNLNIELADKLEKFFSPPFKINDEIHDRYGITLVPKVFLSIGEEFIWPDINSERIPDDDRGFCKGLRDHCAILVDGTVVPCCLDKDGAVPLGNIFNSEMDVILKNERAEKIVEGFSEGRAAEKLCKICEFRKRFSK